MTQISRRALLRSTALIPVALVMDGCAAITAAVAIAPTVAGWISTISSVASVVEPLILGITGLGANVQATIATALADVKSAASGIASATTLTATGLVQKLGSGMNTIATLLSGVGAIPAEVGSFITNGLALIPAIEQAVGITSASPPPAARFARMAATISPDQANANLQLIIAGHSVR